MQGYRGEKAAFALISVNGKIFSSSGISTFKSSGVSVFSVNGNHSKSEETKLK